MKVIRELKTPSSGFAEYLDTVGDDANWDEFRSHNSGASYHELREALTHNQHRLCAYCEDECSVLTPDENGRLDPLFTTNRSYFAPLGEAILAEKPQEWI